MTDPPAGPYLFDTSAQSWLQRSTDPLVRQWIIFYLERHLLHVSAITVMERIRGYAVAQQRRVASERVLMDQRRQAYLNTLGHVWPVDATIAISAGELAAMLPQPPLSPKRSHRFVESRQERIVRWRNDILIAATALAAGLPLVHNNPRDFETIRMAIETVPSRFPGVGPLNLINVLRLAAL